VILTIPFYSIVKIQFLLFSTHKTHFNDMEILSFFRKSLIIGSLCLFSNFNLQAQAPDPRLAREYSLNGEFEKAAEIYKVLYEQNRLGDYYYERYLTTLLELNDYETAVDMLKKAVKFSPEKLERLVDLGGIYERINQKDKANEQYEKAIKLLPNNDKIINKLAAAFISKKLYDWAIQTYEKGEKLLKQKDIFAYELGAAYFQKSNLPKTVECYLNALDFMPNRLTNIQAFFQKETANGGGYEELKKQLFARIQKDANNINYPEMLVWVFMQEGDFNGALRQCKALDKRLNEGGERLIQVADAALLDKDYATTIEAYEYIVKEKGIESIFYTEAKRNLLNAKKSQLLSNTNYDKVGLLNLEKEYETFLAEMGKSKTTADVMQDLADFEARYLQNIDKAIKILEELIDIPQLQRPQQAQAKLQLGDFYLMKGENWEATLLYSQVDKEQKDEPLGELARYKNAKLAYYKGDFEWAQGQLAVLKGSTSELISNDAIDVSVFIMEHLNLDTSNAAMMLYAEADLLCFQNKTKEATVLMDTLNARYKGHNLEDDILYIKAKIAYENRQYEETAQYLQKIVDTYKDGILVDNSLFKMAELYENQLNNPKKAMELYDKIIIDFSGSTFVVESRKRYRKLRGDNIP
jgi:tetratricopeptide (TPR) repeat protein